MFICGLGHFNCDVGPDFSRGRALEHCLSVALCLPSLLASQCMSSCIALLSPEVRWSEMEWLVSLVLGPSAVSTLRNEWALLHVYSLYRNECGCFHVRRAAV